MTAQNHYSQPDQLVPKLQGHQPNPNHSVLVYGPQGCGKTRNTAELLRHFNLQRVIELEAHGTAEIPNEGVLVLTSAAPETLWIEDWPIFSFEDAMRQIVEASAEKGEYTTLPEGVDFIWATLNNEAVADRMRVAETTAVDERAKDKEELRRWLIGIDGEVTLTRVWHAIDLDGTPPLTISRANLYIRDLMADLGWAAHYSEVNGIRKTAFVQLAAHMHFSGGTVERNPDEFLTDDQLTGIREQILGADADTTAPSILRSAAKAIDDRAALRDCPTGERSMARCVAAFNAITGHTLSETEGWHFMSILKLARATAGGHHLDDHTDHAGYAALAGEAAEREANP